MKFLTILFLTILLSSNALGQSDFKDLKKDFEELNIPVKKFQLKNGLTVIIHEDHSDPLVHVNVTYKVGSGNDPLNKSGLAHLFEHLMFEGSENVSDGEHISIISNAGGIANGRTGRDFTEYTQTVPKNYLETVLWLESDRMGFFLSGIEKNKLELQREVVKNERAQNLEASPYELAKEQLYKALYGNSFAYSNLTIGAKKDIDEISLDDSKLFFQTWYAPNNAILAIGGDVKSEEVLPLVEKYFANIAPQKIVNQKDKPFKGLKTNRHISTVDERVRFPQFSVVFPTVEKFHRDEAPLNLLIDMLLSESDSYLSERLVKSRKVHQLAGEHFTSKLSGEFVIHVKVLPNQNLGESKDLFFDELKLFREEGISEKKLDQAQAAFRFNLFTRLTSVSNKISKLITYEHFVGTPDFIKNDINRYNDVAIGDIQRVFDTYIKGKSFVVQSILSNEDLEPAFSNNHNITEEKGSSLERNTNQVFIKELKNKGNLSDFDRSLSPKPGNIPVPSVPDYWTHSLENGLKLIGLEYNEIPLVRMELKIDGGHKTSIYHPEKAGLAYITSLMLNESKKTFDDRLKGIGASIDIRSGNASSNIILITLKESFDEALSIFNQIVLSPVFDAEVFSQIKEKQIQQSKGMSRVPFVLSFQVHDRLMYGEDHIYSKPARGNAETLFNIELDDVKEFHKKYYAPELSSVVLAGDITKQDFLNKIIPFKNWENKTNDSIVSQKVENRRERKIYLLHKPESRQTRLSIGYATNFSSTFDEEFFQVNLLNQPFGVNFDSRVNTRIREQKGWSYSIRSLLNSSYEPIPFLILAGVKPSSADTVVSELFDIMDNYVNEGISEEELENTKTSLRLAEALKYERIGQKTAFLSEILRSHLDSNYLEKKSNMLKNVTKKDIDKLIRKYIIPEYMKVLLVGDVEGKQAYFENRGYKVILLNEDGVVSVENNKE